MTRSRIAVAALVLASVVVVGSGLSSASFAQGSVSSGGSSSGALQGCGDDFDSISGTPPQDNVGPVRNVAVDILDQKVVGGGAELRFTLPEDAFTDADVAAGKGDFLCYRATGMPSWMSFKPNTRAFRGSPETRHIDGDVPIEITVTVRDSANERASDTFTVTVVGNRAPVAPTFPDIVDVHEGKTFRFAIPDARDSGLRHPDAPDDPALSGTVALSPATEHFSDPDGDPISYWIRSKPDWIVFDSRERTIVGNVDAADIEAVAPNGEGARIAEVSIYASDGSAYVEWTLLLRLHGKDPATTTPPPTPNRPPKPGETIAPVTFTETGVRAFAIPESAFVDPDGDELSLRVPSLPPWLSFDTATDTLTADWNMYYLFEGSAKNDARGGHPSTVVVIATDPSKNRAQTTFTVNMLVANSGPTRDVPIQAQRAAEGVPFEFPVPTDAFEDIEGDALVLSTDEAVGWLGFDGEKFYGTPAPGDANAKVRVIGIIATDALGRSARTTFELAMNRPPKAANPIPGKVLEKGSAHSWALPADTFLDPDGDALALSVRGLPGWLGFDGTSRTLSGTLPLDWSDSPRISEITVIATDPYGATAEAAFNLTSNRSPKAANPISPWFVQRNDVDHSRALPAGAFLDPDGDALTYSVTGLPSWLAFDSATRTFSGILSGRRGSDPRVSTILVTATDAHGASATTAFELTANYSPSAGRDSFSGVGTDAAVVGNVLDNDLDDDGDSLLVSRYRRDNGGNSDFVSAGSDVEGAHGTLSITPSGDVEYLPGPGASGMSESFEYRVADGLGGESWTILTVTVLPPGTNRSPVAKRPLGDYYHEFARQYTWQLPAETFRDPDGDVLTYMATGLPSWISFDALTRTFSGSLPSASEWDESPRFPRIVVTATDPQGASASTWFELFLEKPLTIPVAADDELSLNGEMESVSEFVLGNDHDADDDPIAVASYWRGSVGKIGSALPAWNTRTRPGKGLAGDYGVLTITKSGKATYARSPGANEIPAGESRTDSFVYLITDRINDSDSVTSRVAAITVVVAPNQPPAAANAIADRIVGRGLYHEWKLPAGAFSDPEGDSLTYGASGLPSWLAFDAATGIFSGMLETDSEVDPRVMRITVTATDAEGRSAASEFELKSNHAPVGRDDKLFFASNWRRASGLVVNVLENDRDGDGRGTLSVRRYWLADGSAISSTAPAGAELVTCVGTLTITPEGDVDYERGRRHACRPEQPTEQVFVYELEDDARERTTARLTVTLDAPVRTSSSNWAPQVECGAADWNIRESWQSDVGRSRSYFKTLARCAFHDHDVRFDAASLEFSRDKLTYTVAGMPSWVTFDAEKQAFRADLEPFMDIPEGERVSIISVTAKDLEGGTAIAKFTLRHGFAPTPRGDKLSIRAGQAFVIANVLENDVDYEGDAISVLGYVHAKAGRQSIDQVNAGQEVEGDLGTLTISPSGLATYVPNASGRAIQGGNSLEDTFWYYVNDDHSINCCSNPAAELAITIQGESRKSPTTAGRSGPVPLPDIFANTQDWTLPRAGKKWTYAIDLPDDGTIYRFASLPSWLKVDSAITGKLAVSGIVPANAGQTGFEFELVSTGLDGVEARQAIRAFVVPSIRVSGGALESVTATAAPVLENRGWGTFSFPDTRVEDIVVYQSDARPLALGRVTGLNEASKFAQDGAWTDHVHGLTVEGDEKYGTEYGYVEKPVEWVDSDFWSRAAGFLPGEKQIAGKYGTLSFGFRESEDSGRWTYRVENDDADVRALRPGETVQEAFVYAVRWKWSPAELDAYGIREPYYTSDPVLVRISVTKENPPNESPSAVADEIALSSSAGHVDVLANDSDPDGDVLQVTRFWLLDGEGIRLREFAAGTEASTSEGALSVAADGNADFRRKEGFRFGTGLARFEYEISDGRGGLATQRLTVRELENQDPVARDDSMADPLPAGASVLANDFDPDSDELSVVRYWQLDSAGARLAGTETEANPVAIGPGDQVRALNTRYGTVTMAADGRVGFENRSTWSQPETLRVEYEISDGAVASSAVLAISIPARLSPPATPLALPDLFSNTLDWKLPRAGKKWTYAISLPSDGKAYRFADLPSWLGADKGVSGKLAVSGVAPADAGQTEVAFSLVATETDGTETSQRIRAFVVPSVFESSVSDKIAEYPDSRPSQASGSLEFSESAFEDVVVFTDGEWDYTGWGYSEIARDPEWVGHVEGLIVPGSENFGTEYGYVAKHHNWAGIGVGKLDFNEVTLSGFDPHSDGKYGQVQHRRSGKWTYDCHLCEDKLDGQSGQEVFVMAVRWKWTDAERQDYGIESAYYVSNPVVIKIDLTMTGAEEESETAEDSRMTALGEAAGSALMAGAWSRMDEIREGGGDGSAPEAGLTSLLRTMVSEIDGRLAWAARDARSHRAGIVDDAPGERFAPSFAEENLNLPDFGWRLWSGERRDGLSFAFEGESGSGNARTVAVGFDQAVSDRLEVGALVERSEADMVVREHAISQRQLVVSPYWRWAQDGIRIWGTSGMGTGDISHNADGFEMESYHAGVGGEMELARLGLVETKGRVEGVSVFAEIDGAREPTRASGVRAELEAGLPIEFGTGSSRVSVTAGRHQETIASSRSGADFGVGFALGLDVGLSIESAASRLVRQEGASAAYSLDGTIDPRNDGRGAFASLGYWRQSDDSASIGLGDAAAGPVSGPGSGPGRLVVETGFVAAPNRNWVGSAAIEAGVGNGGLDRVGLTMELDSGSNSLSCTAGRSAHGGTEAGARIEFQF